MTATPRRCYSVVLFAPVPDGAEAVIVHEPTPEVVPLAVVVPPEDGTLLSVQGPVAETLTSAPDVRCRAH